MPQIIGSLTTSSGHGKAMFTNWLFDETKNKFQSEVNSDVESRLINLESSSSSGGSGTKPFYGIAPYELFVPNFEPITKLNDNGFYFVPKIGFGYQGEEYHGMTDAFHFFVNFEGHERYQTISDNHSINIIKSQFYFNQSTESMYAWDNTNQTLAPIADESIETQEIMDKAVTKQKLSEEVQSSLNVISEIELATFPLTTSLSSTISGNKEYTGPVTITPTLTVNSIRKKQSVDTTNTINRSINGGTSSAVLSSSSSQTVNDNVELPSATNGKVSVNYSLNAIYGSQSATGSVSIGYYAPVYYGRSLSKDITSAFFSSATKHSSVLSSISKLSINFAEGTKDDYGVICFPSCMSISSASSGGLGVDSADITKGTVTKDIGGVTVNYNYWAIGPQAAGAFNVIFNP